MLGGDEVVEGLDSQKVTEFKNSLNNEQHAAELTKIVEKLSEADNPNNVNNDNQNMEKSDMSNNDDSVLYEIDLNELMDEEAHDDANIDRLRRIRDDLNDHIRNLEDQHDRAKRHGERDD